MVVMVVVIQMTVMMKMMTGVDEVSEDGRTMIDDEVNDDKDVH